MSQPIGKPIDKVFLRAVFGLAAFSVIAVFTIRLTGNGAVAPSAPDFTQSRALVITDSELGAIDVKDGDTGHHIVTFDNNEAGFIRTAMRSVIYNRRMRDIGPETPILIGFNAEGRAFLHDPATSRVIGLDAFGDRNALQFMELLEQDSRT